MPLSNHKDIVEECSFALCMFIFCSRMFLSLGRICQYLDPLKVFNLTLGLVVEILVTIILFILIILSFYHNFKYRNYLSNAPYLNKKILFMVFVPTGMFTVTYKTISALAYIGVGSNIVENLGNLAVTIVLYLLMGVYITDINMYRDDGELWKINFFNVLTILFTFIFFICDCTMILSREQINIYQRQLNSSYSINTKNYASLLIKMMEAMNMHYFKFGILCEFISGILLISPLRRNLALLERYKPKLVKMPKVCNTTDITHVSFLMIGICFFIAFSIILLIFTKFYFSSILFQIKILITCVYFISVLNICFIYFDIKTLPRIRYINKLYYFLLYMGLFGQTIEAFSAIFYVFYSSPKTSIFSTKFMTIVQHSTQLIQCYFQNILIVIILEKGSKIKNHEEFYSFLYSKVILITLNIGFFIANFCNIEITPKVPETELFFVFLICKTLTKIGTSFAILHRASSLLILLEYF